MHQLSQISKPLVSLYPINTIPPIHSTHTVTDSQRNSQRIPQHTQFLTSSSAKCSAVTDIVHRALATGLKSRILIIIIVDLAPLNATTRTSAYDFASTTTPPHPILYGMLLGVYHLCSDDVRQTCAPRRLRRKTTSFVVVTFMSFIYDSDWVVVWCCCLVRFRYLSGETCVSCVRSALRFYRNLLLEI